MLFTAWRNEDTDLRGNFKSHEDVWFSPMTVITEQMKQYVVCNEDFNEIQQQINQVENR